MTLAKEKSPEVVFLRWALPRLGLRWSGYRTVRRQVLDRVGRRHRALGLSSLAEYRAHLETHPAEWHALTPLCRVVISRFFRDRAVFEDLRDVVLPALAASARASDRGELRVWSAGCASGEEPYSLALIGQLAPLGLPLRIVGTDADPRVLARAERARYARGTLREAPPGWIERAFVERDGELELRDELRAGVRFVRSDVRDELPEGPFDLVLCRNLVFTYFDAATAERILDGIVARVREGGALVVGARDRMPPHASLEPWRRCVHRRSA